MDTPMALPPGDEVDSLYRSLCFPLIVRMVEIAVSPYSPGGDSMIRIKAIAAIALAGLGGATMGTGTGIYMLSRASSPPRAIPPPFALTAPSLVAISAAAMPAHERDAVVRL